LAVVVTSVSMGSVPIFARELTDAGLAAVSVSFYRNVLGTILLFRMLRFDRHRRAATVWALGAGLGMGIGWTAYVRALEVVPVSTAGVVYMTYPLFAIVLARLLFKVPATGRSIVAGLVIVAAALLALGAEIGDQDQSLLAVLFAAPLSFGFAIAVLTERMTPLKPLERVAPIALGSTIGLLPLVVNLPYREVVPAGGHIWLYVVGIGLLTAVGPQWLYSKAAPAVGPGRAAIAGAAELPTMFLVGWIAFGENLTVVQGVAGVMVLGAILLAPSRQSPAVTIVRRHHRLIPGRFYSS